jgi:PEP-CTERM motif-containing protein
MPPAARLVLVIVAIASALSAYPALADFNFTHGDHSYLVVEQRRNWAAAAGDAATRQLFGSPGYLAIIDSAAENQAIFTQLANPANIPPAEYSNTQAPDGGNGIYVWIAASDILTEGRWVWDTNGDGLGTHFYQGEGRFGGAAVSGLYNNWGRFGGAPWEPDNAQSGLQDAAGIGILNWPRGNAGEWNDVRADNNLYYVVEFDAVPEPSTLVLAGIATCLLFARLSRRASTRRPL